MITLLFFTATLLGFLAFFEPCTIATHTLFAVRVHHSEKRLRILALTQLLLTRIGLLVFLFGISSAIGLSEIPDRLGMFILFMAGMLYLISRKVYIAVPHVEFYRLFPGNAAFAQAYKLGLTLPACTLPLVLIVGALSAYVHQLMMGVASGVVFALMFTLPTVWSIQYGVGVVVRAYLSKAASISPYLTTFILWFSAFIIFITGV